MPSHEPLPIPRLSAILRVLDFGSAVLTLSLHPDTRATSLIQEGGDVLHLLRYEPDESKVEREVARQARVVVRDSLVRLRRREEDLSRLESTGAEVGDEDAQAEWLEERRPEMWRKPSMCALERAMKVISSGMDDLIVGIRGSSSSEDLAALIKQARAEPDGQHERISKYLETGDRVVVNVSGRTVAIHGAEIEAPSISYTSEESHQPLANDTSTIAPFTNPIATSRQPQPSQDPNPSPKPNDVDQHDPDRRLLIASYLHDALAFRSMGDRMEEVEDVSTADGGGYGWVFGDGEDVVRAGAGGTDIARPSEHTRLAPQASTSHNPASPSTSSTARQPHAGLREWLERGGGTYWINGLPGSGKSTLMGWLYDHRETRRLLGRWAAGVAGDQDSSSGRTGATSSYQLELIGFFCWISGAKEQRTREGMLRSLLYQLLDKRLELVPVAFPTRWEVVYGMTTKERIKLAVQWEFEELSEALVRVLQVIGVRRETRTCIFIDGLDEIEGHAGLLLDRLHRITTLVNRDDADVVKLCVSSRPWGVYERAFERMPGLKLQELTRRDMDRYARSRLGAVVEIARAAEVDPDGWESFLAGLTSRSDGVFLWLTLVVDLLSASAGVETTLDTLRGTLRSFPTTLDELFRHSLIETKDEASRRAMSRTFQLLRAREDVCGFVGDDQAVTATLTLWQLAHAFEAAAEGEDKEEEEEGAPIGGVRPDGWRAPEQMRSADLQRLIGRMHARITGSCSGLIAVKTKKRKTKRGGGPIPVTLQDMTRGKVVYTHRTVRDFLAKPSVWSEIVGSDPDFDPHRSHLEGYVGQLRRPLAEPLKDRLLLDRWLDIVPAMTHARYARPRGRAVDQALNDLDRTLDWYWDRKDEDRSLDYWARDAFGSYEARGKRKKAFPNSFLSLAIKFGLVDFVRHELRTREVGNAHSHAEHERTIPPIRFALEYLFDRQRSVYPLASVEMILLLTSDPVRGGSSLEYTNLEGRSETAWTHALDSARQAYRRGWIQPYDLDPDGTDRWMRIVSAIVPSAADETRHVQLPPTHVDEKGTPDEIFGRIVERYGTAMDEELLRRKGECV